MSPSVCEFCSYWGADASKNDLENLNNPKNGDNQKVKTGLKMNITLKMKTIPGWAYIGILIYVSVSL